MPKSSPFGVTHLEHAEVLAVPSAGAKDALAPRDPDRSGSMAAEYRVDNIDPPLLYGSRLTDRRHGEHNRDSAHDAEQIYGYQ